MFIKEARALWLLIVALMFSVALNLILWREWQYQMDRASQFYKKID